jgi:hypothetical protein
LELPGGFSEASRGNEFAVVCIDVRRVCKTPQRVGDRGICLILAAANVKSIDVVIGRWRWGRPLRPGAATTATARTAAAAERRRDDRSTVGNGHG